MQSTPLAFNDYMQLSASAAAALASDAGTAEVLHGMAAALAASFAAGGKLLVAGNGGSAADAAHIAAEFLSRCHMDRAPLPAVALSAQDAAVTACANDYGVESIFARQIGALGRPGDVLLALSTSGNSPNILAALAAAARRDMVTLGFAGRQGGRMAAHTALLLRAPADHGQIVQQVHMQAAHALLGLVETRMFVPA